MRHPNPRRTPRVLRFRKPRTAARDASTARVARKKFAQFCANGLVRRAKATSFARRRARRRMLVRVLTRGRSAARDAMRTHASANSTLRENRFFPGVFAFACTHARGRAHAPRVRRTSCASSRAASRRDRRERTAKKNCDRLLTVGKTVIRFRPSRRSLQKRVRKQNAITGRITCTSTSSIKRWTPASHPSRKREAPMIETCSVRRRGFFIGRGASTAASRWIAGRLPIRPVRLARRRSLAGPIPAVSFETGLYRYTH